MKKYLVQISIILSLVSLYTACKKDEKIGPDLKELTGPVDFEEEFKVSTTTPNFANGDKVYLNAKFKADTYWVITITGSTSGAVKTISGTGREISETLATWDGTANKPPSFRNEAITITLSFPNASSVNATGPLSYNGTISAVKNLDAGGVLVTNFNVLQTTVKQNYTDTDWETDDDLVNKYKWPSNWVATNITDDSPLIKNPDGNKYCVMGPWAAWEENMDSPGNKTPYIDHLLIKAASVGYEPYFPLIADPNQIYLNVMLYNTDKNSKARFQITLFEKDVFLKDIEKSYSVIPSWTDGWRVISIPYIDFKLKDTTQTSLNPQRITGMQLFLFSEDSQEVLNAASNPVSATFDHLIFTHYKPYQP